MSTERSEQPIPTAPMSQIGYSVQTTSHSSDHTQNASSNPSAAPAPSQNPTRPNDETKNNNNVFIRHASEKITDGAEEQIGEQAVTYVAENGKQQVEDAKEKAQGMWAKYCGCFSSLA